MPPNTNLNGPLIEWSRGSLGDNNDCCRGGMLESARTSWELSSDELKSRGMGRARALDDDAAMKNDLRTWKEKGKVELRTVVFPNRST